MCAVRGRVGRTQTPILPPPLYQSHPLSVAHAERLALAISYMSQCYSTGCPTPDIPLKVGRSGHGHRARPACRPQLRGVAFAVPRSTLSKKKKEFRGPCFRQQSSVSPSVFSFRLFVIFLYLPRPKPILSNRRSPNTRQTESPPNKILRLLRNNARR